MNEHKGLIVTITVIVDIIAAILYPIFLYYELGDYIILAILIYIAIMAGSLIIINATKLRVWVKCIISVIITIFAIFIFFHPTILSDTFHKTKRDYHIMQQEKMLADIEHYEIEFSTGGLGKELEEYSSSIEKFSVPQIITIKELKDEFPIETVEHHPDSIPYMEIPLNDDERVYVYVTVSDEQTLEDVLFEYDELGLTPDGINIRTHFEIIDDFSGCVATSNLIVVSIIPVDQ